jgi:hypothetical protein
MRMQLPGWRSQQLQMYHSPKGPVASLASNLVVRQGGDNGGNGSNGGRGWLEGPEGLDRVDNHDGGVGGRQEIARSLLSVRVCEEEAEQERGRQFNL